MAKSRGVFNHSKEILSLPIKTEIFVLNHCYDSLSSYCTVIWTVESRLLPFQKNVSV